MRCVVRGKCQGELANSGRAPIFPVPQSEVMRTTLQEFEVDGSLSVIAQHQQLDGLVLEAELVQMLHSSVGQ